jgi:hypothetical protein
MCNCTSGNLEIPGSLARRKIDACIDFAARRALRDAGRLWRLDAGGAWPYSRAMTKAATNLIARRHRLSAVWADVCA